MNLRPLRERLAHRRAVMGIARFQPSRSRKAAEEAFREEWGEGRFLVQIGPGDDYWISRVEEKGVIGQNYGYVHPELDALFEELYEEGD